MTDAEFATQARLAGTGKGSDGLSYADCLAFLEYVRRNNLAFEIIEGSSLVGGREIPDPDLSLRFIEGEPLSDEEIVHGTYVTSLEHFQGILESLRDTTLFRIYLHDYPD